MGLQSVVLLSLVLRHFLGSGGSCYWGVRYRLSFYGEEGVKMVKCYVIFHCNLHGLCISMWVAFSAVTLKSVFIVCLLRCQFSAGMFMLKSIWP